MYSSKGLMSLMIQDISMCYNCVCPARYPHGHDIRRRLPVRCGTGRRFGRRTQRDAWIWHHKQTTYTFLPRYRHNSHPVCPFFVILDYKFISNFHGLSITLTLRSPAVGKLVISAPFCFRSTQPFHWSLRKWMETFGSVASFAEEYSVSKRLFDWSIFP